MIKKIAERMLYVLVVVAFVWVYIAVPYRNTIKSQDLTIQVQQIQIRQIISDMQEITLTLTEINNTLNNITVGEQNAAPQSYAFFGKLRITAYCGCVVCCGASADNRPGGIVTGAAGVELMAGISVASNTLPFGTVIYIDGYGERVIQDRIANWVIDKFGETIDIYFDSHTEAMAMGLKELEVWVIGA